MGCLVSNPTRLEKFAGEPLQYKPSISNDTTSIFVSKNNTLWKVCKGDPVVIRQTFMNNYRVKRLSISPTIVCPKTIFKLSDGEIAISMHNYPSDLFSLTLTSFDLQRVFKGLSDIARALQFLHARGLAHRDIKPENIVVDKEYFRLIDFDFTSPVTEFILCGTKDYMYPGSNTQDWELPDRSRRFDIYAFGRTVLFVLYCAASHGMIEHEELITKLHSNNAIIQSIENPFSGTVADWFDIVLACCSETPTLKTFPAADKTVDATEVVYADDIVA